MLLASRQSQLQRLYRAPIDWLEELSTGAADQVVVNSDFTRGGRVCVYVCEKGGMAHWTAVADGASCRTKCMRGPGTISVQGLG